MGYYSDMAADQQVDYDALAKQAGGRLIPAKTRPASSVDYDKIYQQVSSVPTLHELSIKTPEQEHEGLYKMKDEHGNLYGVPYSNVTYVDNFRNNFVDEKEAQRYEKDASSDHPTWKDKLLKHTAPLSEDQKKTIKKSVEGEAGSGDADFVIGTQDFARGFANGAGTLALHPWESLKGMLVQARDAGATILAGYDHWGEHPDSSGEGAKNEVLREKDEFFQMMNDMKGQFKTNSPYAVGQLVGQALVADAAAKPVMKALKVGVKTGKSLVADPKGTITAPLRGLAGTGARAVRGKINAVALENVESIPKAEAEHAQKLKDVREENETKQKEYDKAVSDRNDLVEKKIEATRKAAELRTRLHSHIKDIHQAAVKWFDDRYSTIGKLTKDARVGFDPLIEAVEKAKLQDIAGVDTKVPVFEDVIKRAKGEVRATEHTPKEWAEADEETREEWKQEARDQTGISYKDLTGYHRQLSRLRAMTQDVGVRDAISSVLPVIEKMQGEAAKVADEQAAAEAARTHTGKPPSASQLHYSTAAKYRNFAESYRDADSVGTKAVNADNAVKATKPYLKAKTAEELSDLKKQTVGREATVEGKNTHATDWAGRNSAEDTAGKRLTTKQRRAQTEKLIDQVRKAHEDLNALGNPGKPPTLELTPEPEYVSPEKSPTEGDIHLQNVKNLDAAIERYSNIFKNRHYIPGAIAAGALIGTLAKFVGAGAAEGTAGLASIIGIGAKALGPILDKPWVRDSLTKVTDAQRSELAKLPEKQRAIVAQQMGYMARAAELRGDIPKGASKGWTQEAREQKTTERNRELRRRAKENKAAGEASRMRDANDRFAGEERLEP